MTIPSVPHKHGEPSILTAAAAVADWAEAGILTDDHPRPRGAVLVYDRALFKHLENAEALRRFRFGAPGEYYTVVDTEDDVALVGNFGIGAPVAAAVVEALVAFGVESVVSVGTAGGLQPTLTPGDIVVGTSAVRDEGTSYHYLPAGVEVASHRGLTEHLADALGDAAVAAGSLWTTDAPYRETAVELRHHRDQGIWAVDMEASALMAVCAVHDVPFATAVCVSDVLAETGWRAMFSAPPVRAGLRRLYDAALAALTTHAPALPDQLA